MGYKKSLEENGLKIVCAIKRHRRKEVRMKINNNSHSNNHFGFRMTDKKDGAYRS